MKNIRPLLSLVATAAIFSQVGAWADTAANIQAYPNNSAINWDGNGSYPIVTAILSAPSGSVYNPGAMLDGYSYTGWSYLAADPTGSIDLFYSSTVAGPAANYPLPAVGDMIYPITGNYSPFHGIPEIANSTNSGHNLNILGPPMNGSSGNPPYSPVPTLTTITTINVGTTLPAGGGINASGLAGALIQLNNVHISSVSNQSANSTVMLSNWATHANNQGWITDGSNNSMVMYLWASSYSTCASIAAAGGPIPTGWVDMTGFVSDFYSSATGTTTAEFTPISITAVVPEPAAMALCGLGSVLALVCYRRKKA
jgi:hypothetical protein